MKHLRFAAAAALMLAAGVPAAAQGQQDFRWNGRLASGEEVEIRNLNGDVRAEPSSSGQVEVVGLRRGGDAELVDIRVERQGDGVTICAVFPNSNTRSSNRDDDDGDERRGGACSQPGRRTSRRNLDARVDFVVRVPAGVRLSAATVSGNVDARGLRGPVEAHSVSGDVHVATTGHAEASTVSGDVVATLGGNAGRDLRFKSVSGNVTLHVPGSINADFRARTLSGHIESDFPITLASRERSRDRDQWVNVRIGEQARGTFGRGGPELEVETISGNIRVVRNR
jgi:hypothetical protein